jgi:hypothetical protein
MQAVNDTSTSTETAAEDKLSTVNRIPFPVRTSQITCASRRRPMDTSEYVQAHGTLYRLGPKTSKRARKQQRQQVA